MAQEWTGHGGSLTGDESLLLPEFDHPPTDPVELVRQWFARADDLQVREPGAFTLATADVNGHPSSRVVLLKGISGEGLIFTTHTGSRKGRDLAAMPWASATFYWRETLQQMTVAGPVSSLPEGESDALFDERPVAAQATTAVSQQSTPLADDQVMHRAAQDLIDCGAPLARPDGWCGYRLSPERIEFWQGRRDRLHRRLEYWRDGECWNHQRLQP